MTPELPYYEPASDEVELFSSAVEAKLPVMLVGPTGCGKTRLVAHMAGRFSRRLRVVVGNDDTTTADLLGRYLVHGGDVTWSDGPVTAAARAGDFCYVDEVVEVRREALAALHPLADDRRELHIDRLGETIEAADDFALICSYNPTRSVGFRELRTAFRQRFVTIEIGYLPAEAEAEVVARESGVDAEAAARLVRLAAAIRDAVGDSGGESPSTRLLVHAGQMLQRGVSEARAVEVCVIGPLAHGRDAREADALRELVAAS